MVVQCFGKSATNVAFQKSGIDVMQALPADVVPNRLGISHAPLQYRFKGQVCCHPVGCASPAQAISSL